MNTFHKPVLLKEVLEFLDIKKDCWYIDCNLGGGGHTEEILKLGGKVIGIDLDKEALEEVSKRLKNYIDQGKLILVQDNFKNLDQILINLRHSGDEHSEDARIISNNSPFNIQHSISGILFDLGTSSHQLDKKDRGFSFNSDEKLDMRMDQTLNIPTAADLVNVLHEGELKDLFEKFGEEKFSKRIAKAITEYRKVKRIETTHELSQIIVSSVHRSKNKIHPATLVFQALRIAVNDELNALKETLPKAFELLAPNGRLVVISFHSLEDRIVKTYFTSLRGAEANEAISNNLTIKQFNNVNILTKKPIDPTLDEVYDNPRSRSSKLRAIEKL